MKELLMLLTLNMCAVLSYSQTDIVIQDSYINKFEKYVCSEYCSKYQCDDKSILKIVPIFHAIYSGPLEKSILCEKDIENELTFNFLDNNIERNSAIVFSNEEFKTFYSDDRYGFLSLRDPFLCRVILEYKLKTIFSVCVGSIYFAKGENDELYFCEGNKDYICLISDVPDKIWYERFAKYEEEMRMMRGKSE